MSDIYTPGADIAASTLSDMQHLLDRAHDVHAVDPTGQVEKLYGADLNLAEVLGKFDLQELLTRGTEYVGLSPTRVAVPVLAAAIILAALRAKWREFCDEDPRYVQELGWIVMWAAVMFGFQWLASETIYFVTHLVGKPPEGEVLSQFYHERLMWLAVTRGAQTGGSVFSVDYWMLTLMRVLTCGAFMLVQVYVYVLNAAQSIALACLLLVGPIIIAFAALGLTRFAQAWLLAFIEVCLWSPVLRVILICLSAYGRRMPSGNDYSIILDGIMAFVFYKFLTWAPKFAGMLVGGGGASWMASTGSGVGAAAMSAATAGTWKLAAGHSVASMGATKKALSWAGRRAWGAVAGNQGSGHIEDVAKRYKSMQGQP